LYNLNTLKAAGFEILTVVSMKSTIFWDVTHCAPESLLTLGRIVLFPYTESNSFSPSFQAKRKEAQLFLLLPCCAYSSVLNMVAVRSSETSMYFHWTAQRHIREDTSFEQSAVPTQREDNISLLRGVSMSPKGGRRDLEEKPTDLQLYWRCRRGE
jgi:hypothetical protein